MPTCLLPSHWWWKLRKWHLWYEYLKFVFGDGAPCFHACDGISSGRLHHQDQGHSWEKEQRAHSAIHVLYITRVSRSLISMLPRMRFQYQTDGQIIKATVITEAVPHQSSFAVRLSRWCISEFALLHLQKAQPPSTTSLWQQLAESFRPSLQTTSDAPQRSCRGVADGLAECRCTGKLQPQISLSKHRIPTYFPQRRAGCCMCMMVAAGWL